LQLDLRRQRAELALSYGEEDVRTVSSSERENELRKRRRADPTDLSLRKSGTGSQNEPATKDTKAPAEVTTVVVLRLYIAGGARIGAAITNLEAICHNT
jgi:hypothetical protein